MSLLIRRELSMGVRSAREAFTAKRERERERERALQLGSIAGTREGSAPARLRIARGRTRRNGIKLRGALLRIKIISRAREKQRRLLDRDLKRLDAMPSHVKSSALSARRGEEMTARPRREISLFIFTISLPLLSLSLSLARTRLPLHRNGETHDSCAKWVTRILKSRNIRKFLKRH